MKSRILIVDDDQRARSTTGALLKRPEFEIAFAASGQEALLLAREWKPDLILLDVMMPEVDGFEVCRQLRTDPAISDVRVFLLTSLDDSQSRLRGFESGADDFITKPLNRAEMVARIQGISRLNRIRSVVQQHWLARSLETRLAHDEVETHMSPDELKDALESGLASLRLVYQPIMKIRDLDSTGTPVLEPFAYEALLRCNEPRLPTPPALLAAAGFFRREIDVGQAVRDQASNMLDANPEITLFVNVTSQELEDSRLYGPDERLSRHAKRVVLELTEREPLHDVRQLASRVRILRDAGYRIAIDDLGSGYASLNSFALVEPEFVKLDRVLIREVEKEPTKQKIASAILGLCAELDIVLICEGVETRGEADILKSLGCTLHQGYHYARPGADLTWRQS